MAPKEVQSECFQKKQGLQRSAHAALAWAGDRACASRINALQKGLCPTSSFGSAGRTVKARHWLWPSTLLGGLHKPQ